MKKIVFIALSIVVSVILTGCNMSLALGGQKINSTPEIHEHAKQIHKTLNNSIENLSVKEIQDLQKKLKDLEENDELTKGDNILISESKMALEKAYSDKEQGFSVGQDLDDMLDSLEKSINKIKP
ncbi:hypothetical protein [Fictibacillus barbaricus]|uniref:Lipoprotein n=1 Tax=Fictibacillus barbaricus TaxID=182136 RepID=A0ABS2Z7W2_9BACL|nr:hypothetical protein [Fictibacillus barbaricus]MBN3544118.1 hypothetical protein [Fictibacillus barbaricus]GGB69094.1 hypothetical protein GCM10007199_39100 [Fictibacillus barbaricus]